MSPPRRRDGPSRHSTPTGPPHHDGPYRDGPRSPQDRALGPPDAGPGPNPALVAGLRRLSAGFGGNRNAAGHRYLDDPVLREAYLRWFWPHSHAQARAILRRLPPGRGRALDLGSGPGPVAVALVEAGYDEVWAVDHADAALRIAAERGGPRLRTARWVGPGLEGLPPGPWRLVSLSHVLNELFKHAPDAPARRADLLDALRPALAPDGRVLVVEPATHELNREALRLRDELVRRGWRVRAPCLAPGPCPALAAGAACHDGVVEAEVQADRALARAAGIPREGAAMTWFLLAPPAGPGPAAPGRAPPAGPGPALASPSTAPPSPDLPLQLVSDRLLNKAGRERFLVCATDGRYTLSADPHLDTPWRRLWAELRRGDRVWVGGAERRESGLGLTAGSTLALADGFFGPAR